MGFSGVAAKFNVAIRTPGALPALPSKTNGPASFRGVIGPSAAVEGSPFAANLLCGLGVRSILLNGSRAESSAAVAEVLCRLDVALPERAMSIGPTELLEGCGVSGAWSKPLI